MVILVADRDEGIRKTLSLFLKSEHDVVQCSDGNAVLSEIEKSPIDLVITEFSLPNVSGLDLIQKGKELSPSTHFLVMTDTGSIHQAVAAVRAGAEDYFTKPFDISEIEHRIRKIDELRSLKIEKAAHSQEIEIPEILVGTSEAMQAANKFVKMAATSTAPVLLTGPNGTGKELIARAIHDMGPRAIFPYLSFDCKNPDEKFLENELFGFEKDDFLCVTAPKAGKIELARGGTIFFNEIAELPKNLQAKLSQLLHENQFFRVGSTRPTKANTRIIARTQHDLKKLVKEGVFREDLFYLLEVLSFDIPPLSSRKEDIPPLIQYCWRKITRELRLEISLSDVTKRCLENYPFPGNVREMQNILERLAVIGRESGVIEVTHLPPEVLKTSAGILVNLKRSLRGSLKERLTAHEKEIVSETLNRYGGDLKATAVELQISLSSLKQKIKKHSISSDANHLNPIEEAKAA